MENKGKCCLDYWTEHIMSTALKNKPIVEKSKARLEIKLLITEILQFIAGGALIIGITCAFFNPCFSVVILFSTPVLCICPVIKQMLKFNISQRKDALKNNMGLFYFDPNMDQRFSDY